MTGGKHAAEDGEGVPLKSRSLVSTEDDTEFEALFGFVKAHQGTYPVSVMCRLLRVPKRELYSWM